MVDSETVSSPVSLDQRRMTAWSIYIVDKLMSTSLSRPPAIEDSNYRMRLPDSDATSSCTETDLSTLQRCLGADSVLTLSMGPTTLAILSCSILGNCTKYISSSALPSMSAPWHCKSEFIVTNSNLYQLESLLQAEAKRFASVGASLSELPPSLDAAQYVFAQAIFHLCHCLLNHPFIMRIMMQKVKSKPPMSFIARSILAAEDHARSLTDLLTSRVDHFVVPNSSYFTYCLAIACGIHSLFSNAEHVDGRPGNEGDAHDYFRRSMAALHNLSQLWPMGLNMVSSPKARRDNSVIDETMSAA